MQHPSLFLYNNGHSTMQAAAVSDGNLLDAALHRHMHREPPKGRVNQGACPNPEGAVCSKACTLLRLTAFDMALLQSCWLYLLTYATS